jgi:hypothetical protein
MNDRENLTIFLFKKSPDFFVEKSFVNMHMELVNRG